MVTGQLSEDLVARDVYRALQPFKAWADNYNALTGKEKITANPALNVMY